MEGAGRGIVCPPELITLHRDLAAWPDANEGKGDKREMTAAAVNETAQAVES